ncbi:MAG: hypothetical protein J0H01_38125 [Rhizobiales bacterium]|nr:hypothetical protein [Hyphomicrobiales bacterium]
MNFTFATLHDTFENLLGARGTASRFGRRRSADRPRMMRAAVRPSLAAAPDSHPAGRPRATWRVNAASGRAELCWALETEGDGSRRSRLRRSRLHPATGIRFAAITATRTSGSSHGRLF